MIPASGEVFAENEKVRLCVVKESEKQDYIDLSYTYSCMKSAFKDEEVVGYCAIKDPEKPDWKLADEFGVKPEEMLGKVLEYQLYVKE